MLKNLLTRKDDAEWNIYGRWLANKTKLYTSGYVFLMSTRVINLARTSEVVEEVFQIYFCHLMPQQRVCRTSHAWLGLRCLIDGMSLLYWRLTEMWVRLQRLWCADGFFALLFRWEFQWCRTLVLQFCSLLWQGTSVLCLGFAHGRVDLGKVVEVSGESMFVKMPLLCVLPFLQFFLNVLWVKAGVCGLSWKYWLKCPSH